MNQAQKIHSPVAHVVMYAALLVFTPFIMLQNYLQRTIGELSDFSLEPFGLRLPVMFSITVVLFCAFLLVFRKKITPKRVIAALICILMIAISHRICDFYMSNKFYDLQNNWHYIAYAIFVFMMFRALAPRKVTAAKIVLYTYLSALALSIFDEGFQYFLSSRVFDIGDIAKDGWGVLIGLVALFFIYDEGKIIGRKGWHIRKERMKDYSKSAWSLLALAVILNLMLLLFGSLLTELEYIGYALMFTFGSFIVVFVLLHLSKIKAVRIGIYTALIVVVAAQTISFLHYRKRNIVYNAYGLTVYKGIPIPFFDVMIFPNGWFRLVDKKHYFTPGDKTTIFEQRADIVIIATGAYGYGGLGFDKRVSQFGYNICTKRCTQAIPLKTPDACKVFNRLKKEGKNVLIIIHNTC